MALFFRDDGFDLTHRQEGFGRYRQLMSFYGFHWLKINMITTLGALPLAFGISFAILTSSLLVLLPVSVIGGMIFGPFWAGLVDAIMRGLRDAPGNWKANYKKSWKQNWKGSLLPGGIFGLFVGLYAFMFYIMGESTLNPTLGTILMYLVSASLMILVGTLYWPQLVLFRQKGSIRMKNAILFTIKHSTRVLGAVIIQLAWIVFVVLLAPWTLTLVPFFGFWIPLFLALFRLYDDLNRDFAIEAQFIPIEGDPWAEDPFTADETEELINPYPTDEEE